MNTKNLSVYNQDKVLKILIEISEGFTGKINYSVSLYSDIQKSFKKLCSQKCLTNQEIFKLLLILDECGYIDIDYPDYDKYAFSEITISAKGYNHHQRKRSDDFRFWSPFVVALLSLGVAIAALFR